MDQLTNMHLAMLPLDFPSANTSTAILSPSHLASRRNGRSIQLVFLYLQRGL